MEMSVGQIEVAKGKMDKDAGHFDSEGGQSK